MNTSTYKEQPMNANRIHTSIQYLVTHMGVRFLREVITPFTLSTYPGSSLEYAARVYQDSLSSSIKFGLNGRFARGVALAKNNGVTKYTDPEQPDKIRLYRVRSS